MYVSRTNILHLQRYNICRLDHPGLFPFWKRRDEYLLAIIIMLLAIIYSWLIFTNIGVGDFKKFNTLQGVSELFENRELLLAGWIHYLALDLLTGIFIVNDSQKKGINYWFIVPVLPVTFLLAPFGLLLYFIIRTINTRKFISRSG